MWNHCVDDLMRILQDDEDSVMEDQYYAERVEFFFLVSFLIFLG